MSSAWHSSPRQVDLLSWFTGPLVPLVFGGVAVIFGGAVTFALVDSVGSLVIASIAIIMMAAAFGLVAYYASPRRRLHDAGVTVLPIFLGWISFMLAVASEWGSLTPFELRWSPIALGLLIASLAPFLPAIRIVVLGILSSIVTVAGTAASLTAAQGPSYWPFIVQLLLGSTMVLIATAAATVFSYQVVARTMAWANSTAGNELSGGVLGEAARRRILRQEMASVSERALPLLTKVAETGVVSPEERDEARALAESLRAELVEKSNRSWLEALTGQLHLTVIDHERRAERMSPSQRSALLRLLTAAAAEIIGPANRTVIELRGEPDGSTAVAISSDHTLPDGHRLTLLAPHYVSLLTAVEDVEWETEEKRRPKFRI